MDREQGINLVKMYDNYYPEEWIDLYLDYYNMSKPEFDNVLDSHINKGIQKEKWKVEPIFQVAKNFL